MRMIRIVLAVFVVSLSPAANAADRVLLDIAAINAQGWKLQGVNIALTGLSESSQKLVLTINTLTLPKPFEDLQLADIRCLDFSWQNNEIWCRQGRAAIRSRQWQSPSTDFVFHISERSNSFKLKDLRLFDGKLAVDAVERGDQWQVQIQARALDGRIMQKLWRKEAVDLKNGTINLDLKAAGSLTEINSFNLSGELNGLTLQAKGGLLATEALALSTTLNARNDGGLWHWQSQSRLIGGGLYIDPVYLDAAERPIDLDAFGDWHDKMNLAEIKSVHYRHADTGDLTGSAVIRIKGGVSVEKADLSLSSDDLQRFSSSYLKPFLEQTAFDGVTLAGRLHSDFSIVQHAVTSLSVLFNNLDITDAEGRLGVSGGAGSIYWSNDDAFKQSSQLAWRKLKLRALPIGAARLSFLAKANTVSLLEKVRLPFLEGQIVINQFNWQWEEQQEPKVYFEGNLSNVSLEQLSRELDWTPLSGTISGKIPGVEYRDNTLKLGGELMIQVFDGIVKIKDLALSGLFTDFPTLDGEIEIDNLDLDQLTSKFEFGGITGRLSGFVKNMTLENWKPVTFYAWLGTPDHDDSRHRISQKAVKNIASIGGGGATDFLSRTVLSLFENFGYDKIGMGCYLHNGICQLMGLEATPTGYAIIKGGGLPRIDVIGYNPQIDWDTLVERLKRISTSDEVIIE